tara:strand:- start:392 stop:511 length:120 start_codon:yes stop_codon:yes gene_type:complete
MNYKNMIERIRSIIMLHEEGCGTVGEMVEALLEIKRVVK